MLLSFSGLGLKACRHLEGADFKLLLEGTKAETGPAPHNIIETAVAVTILLVLFIRLHRTSTPFAFNLLSEQGDSILIPSA